MILKNQLYKISESDSEQKTFCLSLIADNLIYRAHFPEQPITPGVCIIQIAVELFSDLIAQEVELVGVNNAKFVAVINPIETPSVHCRFKKVVYDDETSIYKVTAEIYNNEIIYTKLSLSLKKK
jgi:3-hydroxyacyl-[acyl-carrier-protein] dehydratase